MQAVLEILVHVVRGSVVKHSAPIPATFVQEIFPVAVKRILDSSDSAILQVCVCVCVCVCVGGFCKKIKTNNKFKGGMAFFRCLITGRGHLLGLTMPNL